MRVLFSINLSITVMRITWWFCWTGAAEDGRAPTEERSWVRDGASDRRGRSRTDALRLNRFRVVGDGTSVRRAGEEECAPTQSKMTWRVTIPPPIHSTGKDNENTILNSNVCLTLLLLRI